MKCKCFISVGHDEYWDRRQYDSVVQMRDGGVKSAVFVGQRRLLGHAATREQ